MQKRWTLPEKWAAKKTQNEFLSARCCTHMFPYTSEHASIEKFCYICIHNWVREGRRPHNKPKPSINCVQTSCSLDMVQLSFYRNEIHFSLCESRVLFCLNYFLEIHFTIDCSKWVRNVTHLHKRKNTDNKFNWKS